MNACNRINHHGEVGTSQGTAQAGVDHVRLEILHTDAGPVQVSGIAGLPAPSAGSVASQHQHTPAKVPPNCTQSLGLFRTTSGLDITQRVIELFWEACERSYLTFELVHEAFPGEELTSDDMTTVCRALKQAGVNLVHASKPELVQSAAPPAEKESPHLKTQRAFVPNCVEQPGQPQLLQLEAHSALSRMEVAEHEMRRILYSFGFAAHEHIARAEKLLGHHSEQTFEHLVADSETQSRRQYLAILPSLVKKVRALDRKAAAAYREWRQAAGQPHGEKHRTEFRELDGKLRLSFPRFCYQTKVIQEMTAIAQNIAGKFRASQHVLEQAQRRRDSVFQMTLVDVERQTVETMEEFVRLPCEVFLRNCTQLKAAETRFQRARGELIRGHLHLAASIAETYSNRGLTLPELIRAGIVGLIRAVGKFGYRREWKFSAYAACWIRHNIRDALAAQVSSGRSPPIPTASENHTRSGQPKEEGPLGDR